MSNPLLRTPSDRSSFGRSRRRRSAEGMQTYVLLPDLDELLGVPGFGLRDPIVCPREHGRLSIGSPELAASTDAAPVTVNGL